MRLAILADVHGNLPALEAVLDDVQSHNVDGIVVAGDLTGGPHSVEVVHLLRSLDSQMIRGNSDTYLLRYDAGNAPEAWKVSRQWAPMRWVYRRLDRETLDFLASLPEQLVVALPGTAPIRVVHGSPRNPSELIFPDRDPAALDLALAQIDELVLVCAHTHLPWKQTRGDRLALNPGAICGPLNGDVRAQYALLAWEDGRWQAEHHAIPYDLDQIRNAFRDSGFLAEGGALVRAFLLSIETARNTGLDFLSYAYELAAEAGFEDCEVVPDEIWEEAVATWGWDEASRTDGVK